MKEKKESNSELESEPDPETPAKKKTTLEDVSPISGDISKCPSFEELYKEADVVVTPAKPDIEVKEKREEVTPQSKSLLDPEEKVGGTSRKEKVPKLSPKKKKKKKKKWKRSLHGRIPDPRRKVNRNRNRNPRPHVWIESAPDQQVDQRGRPRQRRHLAVSRDKRPNQWRSASRIKRKK